MQSRSVGACRSSGSASTSRLALRALGYASTGRKPLPRSSGHQLAAPVRGLSMGYRPLSDCTPRVLLLKGPSKGPEPALGFFEKKPRPDCPKNLESHVDMSRSKAKQQQKFRPTSPGVARIARTFFRFRYYYYYYYANVTFSFTLR